MISLVITSMIVTTLYSALAAVAKSWDGGVEKTAVANERRAAVNFMRSELTQLAPLRLRTRRVEKLVFDGETDAVTFAAPIPSHRASGGLFLVSFLLENDGPKKALVFRYRRLSVDAAIDPAADDHDWEEKVLIHDIDDVAFEYFGGTDTVGSWEESWDSDKKAYPEAVRMMLGFQQDEGQSLDLIVPVRAHPERRTRRLALMLREPQSTPGRRSSDSSAESLSEEDTTQ